MQSLYVALIDTKNGGHSDSKKLPAWWPSCKNAGKRSEECWIEWRSGRDPRVPEHHQGVPFPPLCTNLDPLRQPKCRKIVWWERKEGVHPAKRRAPECVVAVHAPHHQLLYGPERLSAHTFAGVAFLAWHRSPSLASGVPSRLPRLTILRLNGFFRGARASQVTSERPRPEFVDRLT